LPLLWQRILRRDRSHDATGRRSVTALPTGRVGGVKRNPPSVASRIRGFSFLLVGANCSCRAVGLAPIL